MNLAELRKLLVGTITAPPLPPVNLVLPVISGTTTEGETLSATTGTWSYVPDLYAFQWNGDDLPIAGATEATYLLGSADVGTTITVTATATNAAGSTSATSTATAVIAAAGTVLPSSQTVAFGDKTRRGHGGYDARYNGTGYLAVAAGNTGGVFAFDSHKKLVFAGTFGNAPPALSGPYDLTVAEYSDAGLTIPTGVTGSVTVNIEANVYNVQQIDSGTNADLTTTLGARQLGTVMSLAAPGDAIKLRDGMVFNPNDLDWRVRRAAAASVATAMTGAIAVRAVNNVVTSGIADSQWIKITADTPYGATVKRILLEGTNQKKQGFWFHELNLQRSGVSSAGSILKLGNGSTANAVSYVRVSDCTISSNTDTATQLTSSTVSTAIESARDCTDLYIHDNAINGVYDAIALVGPQATADINTTPANFWIAGNTATNVWNDFIKCQVAAPVFVLWNTVYNKRTAAGGAHPDFEQRLPDFAAGSPSVDYYIIAGTYNWGCSIGNIYVRGEGWPTFKEGQGIFSTGDTADTAGVIYTGVEIKANLYVGTFNRAISIYRAQNPDVAWNTLVQDQTAGIVNPDPVSEPQIYLGYGTTGSVRYNAIYENVDYVLEGGHTTPTTVVGNVKNIKQGVYAAHYNAPAYGSDTNTKAEILNAWAMKPGGPLDLAVSGAAAHAGAVGTGYVDYDARTTSFPTG